MTEAIKEGSYTTSEKSVIEGSHGDWEQIKEDVQKWMKRIKRNLS